MKTDEVRSKFPEFFEEREHMRLAPASLVVLGVPADGKVSLVVSVTQPVVDRGVRAGDVVKPAAGVVGGGGGGRPTMAQAGGRDPSMLPDALGAARAEIERILIG